MCTAMHLGECDWFKRLGPNSDASKRKKSCALNFATLSYNPSGSTGFPDSTWPERIWCGSGTDLALVCSRVMCYLGNLHNPVCPLPPLSLNKTQFCLPSYMISRLQYTLLTILVTVSLRSTDTDDMEVVTVPPVNQIDIENNIDRQK